MYLVIFFLLGGTSSIRFGGGPVKRNTLYNDMIYDFMMFILDFRTSFPINIVLQCMKCGWTHFKIDQRHATERPWCIFSDSIGLKLGCTPMPWLAKCTSVQGSLPQVRLHWETQTGSGWSKPCLLCKSIPPICLSLFNHKFFAPKQWKTRTLIYFRNTHTQDFFT